MELFNPDQMRHDLHTILLKNPTTHLQLSKDMGVPREVIYRFLTAKKPLQLKNMYKISSFIMKNKELLED